MTLGTNPKVWSIFAVALMATVFCSVALAQEDMDPSGKWEATVPTPQGDQTVLLTLDGTDGQWSGQLTGRTGEAKDLTGVRVNGNRVQFKFPVDGMDFEASFSGTLGEDGESLAGTISVPNFDQKQELLFHRSKTSVEGDDGIKKYRVGSGPAGVWVGRVRNADGDDTDVTLTVDSTDSGDYIITLEDAFVESVRGENVKVTDSSVAFTFRPQGAPYPSHFTGTYIAADDRVSGSFSQRGASRFVKFERDPTTVILGIGPDGEIIEPARTRHQHRFGVTARMSYWAALHMVKDETYNINCMTTGQFNYDGALRWYAMDGFAIHGRIYHGGFGITDDPKKLERFAPIGLNENSTMKMDGWEFGITGYFGNIIKESSHFNPFMTAVAGKASWEVYEGDRGSDVVAIEDQPLSGKDWAFGFGLGTEYELSSSWNLEFEWMWRYFMTEDKTIWPNVDEDWSNTHAWALSLGVTYLFF